MLVCYACLLGLSFSSCLGRRNKSHWPLGDSTTMLFIPPTIGDSPHETTDNASPSIHLSWGYKNLSDAGPFPPKINFVMACPPVRRVSVVPCSVGGRQGEGQTVRQAELQREDEGLATRQSSAEHVVHKDAKRFAPPTDCYGEERSARPGVRKGPSPEPIQPSSTRHRGERYLLRCRQHKCSEQQ